ncbi:putative quinol monooxygenase [Orbus sturtevantii]|uniref:putative quinol monooxygenase n=1 Tax=Orbus sturtevantii TaxID=3074109 RepID=UPI00370D7075
MSKLNIVAILTIKPEFSRDFQIEFKKVVAASRKEPGCIQYDLNQDTKDSHTYIFTESWQSAQAIDEHNTTSHYKKFAEFADGKVAKKIVHIMKQVI